MMLQEVGGLDKVVADINDELERTKIELKSKSRISILGPAQIPQVGDAKKRLPMTAAAGLFGLFAPLMLLLAFDLKRQPVNGRETITEVIRIPVLGSMPRIPQRVLRRLARNTRSRSGVWRRRLDESVSAITSLLLHKLDLEGNRIVLVTSAASGEGKSTLVAHLAASLAESGHSTLLIDFDLRRPVLHRFFNLPMKPGVTDVLRAGMELEQAVQSTELPNLRVLTAGSNLHGSLLQDASNGSLKALFANARANYEIVLVDSCPLLPVMDGRLVGQYTDGAVLSVIKDISNLPQITAACSIMLDYGIPTLGCVVMGDSQSQYYTNYSQREFAQRVGV
jgi:succinoglycan biosynthesis transport protein ExoP